MISQRDGIGCGSPCRSTGTGARSSAARPTSAPTGSPRPARGRSPWWPRPRPLVCRPTRCPPDDGRVKLLGVVCAACAVAHLAHFDTYTAPFDDLPPPRRRRAGPDRAAGSQRAAELVRQRGNAAPGRARPGGALVTTGSVGSGSTTRRIGPAVETNVAMPITPVGGAPAPAW